MCVATSRGRGSGYGYSTTNDLLLKIPSFSAVIAPCDHLFTGFQGLVPCDWSTLLGWQEQAAAHNWWLSLWCEISFLVSDFSLKPVGVCGFEYRFSSGVLWAFIEHVIKK